MKIKNTKAWLLLCGLFTTTMGLAQMNYTNLEWTDRTPVVGNTINHSASIVVSGYLYVTSNVINLSGNTDILTIKYDTDGDTLWMSTYAGSAGGDDYGVELKASSDGYIYVVGAAKNTSTGYDYCLLKYDSSTGSQSWVRNWNGAGNGDDIPSNLLIESTTRIYVCGGSEATNGLSDFGVFRVSNSNSVTWSGYYDYNSLHDAATSIAISGSNIVVSGGSAAAVNDWDIAAVTFNKTTGVVSASTRTNITGATMVEANAMTTDALNNIYITGYAVVSGEKNIQTVKLDSNLALTWIQEYTAGTYSDEGNDIGVDGSGNVYVTGYNEVSAGGNSNFITIKYNSGGTQQWIKQIGNAGDNEIAEAQRMVVENDGDFYLTGTSTINSQSKMLFVKYNDDGDIKLVREYASDTVDYNSYDITVHEGDVYITGLEKTISATRLTVLKYGISERTMTPVLDENDKAMYIQDEVIIEFRPQDLFEGVINQKDRTHGDLSDFLDSDVIDDLNIYYPGLDWGRTATYKIFNGLTTDDTISITPTGHEVEMYPFYAYLLVKIPGQDESAVLDSLRNHMFPYVQSVQLNSCYKLLTDDPNYSSQTSLFPSSYPNGDINAEQAWTIETGKSNVKVGIYDSGIMYTHTDLGGSMGANKKIKDGKDYYTGGHLSTVGNNGDEHGHGTSVAGILGAYTNNDEGIAGIGGGNWPYDNTVTTPSNPTTENQGVSLYGFKIITEEPLMSLDLTSQALLEGSSNTTGSYGYGLHIINCSFQKEVDETTNDDDVVDSLDLMYDVQRQIFKNGTVMIAARGNDNDQNYLTPSYALKEFWVIGVGGSDTSGNKHPNASYGRGMDLIAPHSPLMIYTTSNTGNDDYTSFSGTSAAAPHVSGVAGLMLSHINDLPETPNNLRPDDVERLLEIYAFDKTNLNSGGAPGYSTGYDHLSGFGVLDAGNVMTHIDRNQYVIRHYYVDTTFVLGNAIDVCGGISCFSFPFGDETHEYGGYGGKLYQITIAHQPVLNMGDIILNSWPLNSYTNLCVPNITGEEGRAKKENQMELSIIDLAAYMSGYTVLITTGPDGDIPDFWYPVAPGDPVKLGYTMHLESDYASTEEQKSYEFDFSCYPNPASNNITLDFTLSDDSNVSIEVVDVQGRVVYSQDSQMYTVGRQIEVVNLNNLSKGIYVIRMMVNEDLYYEKFVKE